MALYAMRERHLRHRTAAAGAQKAYLYHTVDHVDQLDIATVGLQGWTDVFQS